MNKKGAITHKMLLIIISVLILFGVLLFLILSAIGKIGGPKGYG